MAAISAAQLGQTAPSSKDRRIGRHLPYLGVHPDQGAARTAPRGEDRQNAKSAASSPAAKSRSTSPWYTLAGQGVGGHTKGVEFLFKKNKITWIKGTATLAGARQNRSRRSGEKTGRPGVARSSSLPGSAPRGVPGIEDRSQTDHYQRRCDPSARRCRKSLIIMGSGAVGVEFVLISQALWQ